MSTLSYWNESNPLIYDNTTIVDRARKRTEVYPDVIPFVERSLSGSRRSITNREFLSKVEKVAKYLVSIGVQKGDKIAIFGQNSLEWIIGEFAIFFAGAVSVHVNILRKDASDALESIDICKCKCLLIDPTDSSSALRLITDFKQRDENNNILLLKKNENCQFHHIELEFDLPDRKLELPHVVPEDDAVIFTTSGSTGNPKLVLHTHYGIVCNVPSDEENPGYKHYGGPSKFVVFNDRTFSWLGGSPITNFLYGNQSIFTSSSAHPTKEQALEIWNMIKEEKCTSGWFLPYLMQNIIDAHEKLEDDGFRLSFLFSGGQIMDETFVKAIYRYSNLFFASYGFTESFAGVSMFMLKEDQPYHTGYTGKVSKGVELRIVDESENIVPLETQGEIQIRQKALFKEYFGNEKLTKEVLTSEGWFKSGDIGYLREEGTLFITGRKKDIISRGSRKITPGSIEDKIKSMPGIKHVVVIGVPDDRLLEEVCVCFIPFEGIDLTPAAVEEFCQNIFLKEESADGMGEMPKYFVRFEAFPSLQNGKLDKVQLKLLATENLPLGE
ncbi:long-chain-fatty-acid--CoA ligase FadD15-like [Ylistrum balloti]|uniref:long-chain-fatty-acid--CoA ligase FadD15-like n=1 Tax=Ylistrum balloti TaxID=509963 RepID=UPI002905A764|nr:long-chain-fatty-acid--CoA ligase FadD15-like [Ylistrum balloti]